MFWVFILACLTLLWGVIDRQATAPPVEVSAPTTSSIGHNLLVNVLPFVVMMAIWIFVLFNLGSRRLRKLYRKDPSMQGVFTVEVTPGSFATSSTAGTTSRTGWNIYSHWREAKDLIVLVMHSQAYFVMNLANLSEPERTELRGILSTALPRK